MNCKESNVSLFKMKSFQVNQFEIEKTEQRSRVNHSLNMQYEVENAVRILSFLLVSSQ